MLQIVQLLDGKQWSKVRYYGEKSNSEKYRQCTKKYSLFWRHNSSLKSLRNCKRHEKLNKKLDLYKNKKWIKFQLLISINFIEYNANFKKY